MLLTTPVKAQLKIAENVRAKRIAIELTQEGLAERSGVPLATLRKFEQKGAISLESLIKLLMVTGGVEELIEVLKPAKPAFKSIDDVLKGDGEVTRKRGRRR
ncbi:helix-turn-helix domain-containing protein [Mucilaginibacter auburnensis]|uniref:Helix-turn-helix protein n=1 Tax=Mucilaginibacter auburnensis TaxID=1457233 RepID=A0A2H9VQ31_9SPHI|nr:helix-turn-helix transcriptional regulator [Mucilaginibacter auburnensis]PJJ80425.1 helix-turn-helix protein [Mucilaginibacter auburnensis]